MRRIAVTVLALAACGAKGEGGALSAVGRPDDASATRDAAETVVADEPADCGLALPGQGEGWFVEAAGLLGLDFTRAANPAPATLPDFVGGGVCLLDADGDDWLDVFLVDRGPHRLFLRDRCRFVDRSAAWSVPPSDGSACAVGDVNGDGRPDVVVTGRGPALLLVNDGAGFSQRALAAGLDVPGWGTAPAFGDLDADGDLDLYVGRFVTWDAGRYPDDSCANALCAADPARFPPERGLLFINRGDGTFSEEGLGRGLRQDGGPTLAALLTDLDADGDLDLYAANDLGRLYPDEVYRNDGTGQFTEAALAFGLPGPPAVGDSMGIAAADLDDDGAPEIILSNFLGVADQLLDCEFGGDGNVFGCDDRGAEWGLSATAGVLDWAVLCDDFDRDGRADLLSIAGHVHPPSLNALYSGDPQPMEQRSLLHRGRDGAFEAVTAEAAGPPFQRAFVGRGAARGDLDRDGDLDLVVTAVGSPAQLWLGQPGAGCALRLRIMGPAMIGAIAEAVVAGVVQRREVQGGGSFLSASDPTVWFGLGGASRADRVRVHFPSGAEAALTDVPCGVVDLREP